MNEPVEEQNPGSGILFSVFLIVGLGLSLVAGYKGYDWPGVFAPAAIIGLGYVISRASQIKTSGRNILVEFILTTLVWAMMTGLIYLLGSAFSG